MLHQVTQDLCSPHVTVMELALGNPPHGPAAGWGIPVLGKCSASPVMFAKQQQVSGRDPLLKTPAHRVVTETHHQNTLPAFPEPEKGR